MNEDVTIVSGSVRSDLIGFIDKHLCLADRSGIDHFTIQGNCTFTFSSSLLHRIQNLACHLHIICRRRENFIG